MDQTISLLRRADLTNRIDNNQSALLSREFLYRLIIITAVVFTVFAFICFVVLPQMGGDESNSLRYPGDE